MHDEELGSCRVRISGTCHGEYSALVGQVVLYTICSKFTFNVMTRATHTCSSRITALDHKSGDDTVEDQTVIETFLCQVDKILNTDRRHIRIQLQLHDAAILHLNSNNRIRHFEFSFLVVFGPSRKGHLLDST